MPRTIRAFIGTHRPTRFDEVERSVYQPISHKFAYGVRVEGWDVDRQILMSWVRSKEPLLAQISATACVLDFAERELDEFIIELVLRSEYLRQRIEMIEARLLKKQLKKKVRAIKNEELWEDTARRLQLHGYGIRPAMGATEDATLEKIENSLKWEFYTGSKFATPKAPDPLADIE